MMRIFGDVIRFTAPKLKPSRGNEKTANEIGFIIHRLNFPDINTLIELGWAH